VNNCIKIIVTIGFGPVIFTSALAQEQHASLGKELARAFIGACLQTIPDLQRIETAAQMLKWAPVTDEAKRLLSPKSGSLDWKGWLVNRGPAPPFFLAISRNQFRGEEMATCVVVNPYAPVQEVLPHLEAMLRLPKPLSDEIALGQRTRVWQITDLGQQIFVVLTDATPTGEPGLHLTGMTKARPPR
jgi:hypothetical protein